MDLNQLTIKVRNLEKELLNFVSVDSLIKIKCKLFNNYNLVEENQIINLLIDYSNKLEKQLFSKTRDDNNVFPLIDKCLNCGKTRLIDVWGDWEYNNAVRFTSGYCSDKCFLEDYPELKDEWKTI